MKLASSALFLAALVIAPAVAAAQPGSPPPPPGYYGGQPRIPGGFHNRAGHLALGIGLGLGGMKSGDSSIACENCDFNPLTGAFDFHIGGMLSPQLALLLEIQANGQTVRVEGNQYVEGEQTLVQSALMGAAQYWVTPQLWLKGGLGFAHLEYSYSDYYGDAGSEPVADGTAVLLGAGYELLSAPNFAIDLQGRFIIGNYDGLEDRITSGTIGVGFNWY